MSLFKFTSPTGQVFEISGPAGATEAQAREIFNKQLSTGSLVGLKAGDALSALTQAKSGLSSALSQLGPNVSKLTGASGLDSKLPSLIGTPVVNGINTADFVKQNVAKVSVGSINSTQVQGLVAQAAATVGQATSAITNDKGLGKFGLDAKQLQQGGLLKPGTAEKIAQSPGSFTQTLSSPAVWTGVGGATNLNSVLSNEKLQTSVQQGLMQNSLSSLTQIGAVTGSEAASKLGPVIQNATKFGVGAATQWVNGAAPSALAAQLNDVAKSANFAQSFADLNSGLAGGGSPLQAGIKKAVGFANTTNRKTVDSALTSIIGNPKVPTPSFSTPPADIAAAAASQISAGLASGQALLSSVSSLPGVAAKLGKLASSIPGLPSLGSAAGLASSLSGLPTSASSLLASAGLPSSSSLVSTGTSAIKNLGIGRG